jgi:hypothetical protein
MKHNILFCILAFTVHQTIAQFTLDGQLRPRTEYRHGFGNIIPDSADAGFATSTRVRLNAGFQTESYELYLSLQDVMVWGENRQLLAGDQDNSFSIFEAWAKLKLAEGLAAKVGRQVISYDDQRLLGEVDWTQQARNHDAALLQYADDKFMIDAGLAFNQDFSDPSGFQSVGTTYATSGFFSYKTMQYIYARKKWINLTGSLLILNNGFQNFDAAGNGDGTSNLQTLGTHLNYKKERFGAVANAFIQTGERQGELEIDGAYLLGLELTYKITAKIGIGLGTELISGNKSDTTDKSEAFFPLYGTNHKFNGFMDYFYVGNHGNSIGIIDLHASAGFNLGKESDLLLKVLNFNGQQQLPQGERSLGTEIDVVFSKSFRGYGLKIGYSHLFPADGMYELKGVPKAAAASSQNWAWAMVIFKPEFLNTSTD